MVNGHNVPYHIIIVLNHTFLFFPFFIFKYNHVSADIVCVFTSVYTGVTSRFASNCKVSLRLSGLSCISFYGNLQNRVHDDDNFSFPNKRKRSSLTGKIYCTGI